MSDTTSTDEKPAKKERQHFTLAERLARMNLDTFAKARAAHAEESAAFTAEVERRKAAAAAL